MPGTRELVDHLFRHQAGRMHSVLLRIFGAERFDLVEDVVQEALQRALEVWPMQGVPTNPTAWLIQVAKNRALDVIRREGWVVRGTPDDLEGLMAGLASQVSDPYAPGPCQDDMVAMLFLCCHPAIAHESQVVLALKAVAGLGIREIARGLLIPESTAAQRLVRAKRRLREGGIALGLPVARALDERRQAVHDVLYLWFNEGYLACGGVELVRADLCLEALRIAHLMATHPVTTSPQGHALAALMALTAARLPARQDAQGGALLLHEQDRSKWDSHLLGLGYFHLDRCAAGKVVSPYHLEAGIAAAHASAASVAATDWPEIALLYERLCRASPSPVVALNHAVAVAHVQGPHKAIQMLMPLLADKRLENYHLLPAVIAHMHALAGEWLAAATWYQKALDGVSTQPQKALLQERLRRAKAQVAHA